MPVQGMMEWPPHSGTVQTFPEIDRVVIAGGAIKILR
jgi:predicted NUDIX family NTP pyrophosphohydrolase